MTHARDLDGAAAEPRSQHSLSRAVDALSRALATLAALALVLILGLVLVEMVGRGALSRSFAFTWEYAGYAVAVVIFGGLGWTLRTGGHIRVSLLDQALPRTALRAVRSAAAVVEAALALTLALAVVRLALGSAVDGTRSFLGSETPLVVPQALVALGALGFAFQSILRTALVIRGEEADLRPSGAERQDVTHP